MDITEQTNVSWIIKHRPKSVVDVVGAEARHIKKYIDQNNLPHFLFESRTPGTGKTTLAKAIIHDTGADYLEINSSMDRSIENIRTKVQFFVSTMSSNPGVKKIVFMDEFDGMLKPVQDALRNMMETYAHNVVFILTCNYIEKVIDPIKNRCEVIKFGSPNKQEVYAYLEKICKTEQVRYVEEGLNKLIDIYYPSIRNMVGELQRFKTLDVEVTERTVRREDEKFDELWNKLKAGKVLDVRKTIVEEGYEPDLLIKYFFDKTFFDKELSSKQVVALSRAMAEIEYRMAVGADKKIQILSGVFEIYMALVK